MEKKESHWRNQLKVPYLSGDELEGELVVTITKFTNEEIYSQEARKKENKTILYFNELKKGLVVTKRKAKQISKALKTPYMLEWINNKITLYSAIEKHFGETMPVINVKIEAPQLPVLKESDTVNWNKIKEALKNNYTIEAIRTKWNISEANYKKLSL